MFRHLRTVAEADFEARRAAKVTYTAPLDVKGPNAKEISDFLYAHRRNFKASDAERILAESSVVWELHAYLVPDLVSEEDFWQRYSFRCNKVRIMKQLEMEDPKAVRERARSLADRMSRSGHQKIRPSSSNEAIAALVAADNKPSMPSEASFKNFQLKAADKTVPVSKLTKQSQDPSYRNVKLRAASEHESISRKSLEKRSPSYRNFKLKSTSEHKSTSRMALDKKNPSYRNMKLKATSEHVRKSIPKTETKEPVYASIKLKKAGNVSVEPKTAVKETQPRYDRSVLKPAAPKSVEAVESKDESVHKVSMANVASTNVSIAQQPPSAPKTQGILTSEPTASDSVPTKSSLQDKMNTLVVLKSKISCVAEKNGDPEAPNPANAATQKGAAFVEEAPESVETPPLEQCKQAESTEKEALSPRAANEDSLASDPAKQSVEAQMVASASMSGPSVDSVVELDGSTGHQDIPKSAVFERQLQTSPTVSDSPIGLKAEEKELEEERMALDESRRVLDEQKLQLDIEERLVKERRVALEAEKKKLEEEEIATMKLQAALEAKKTEIEAEKKRLEANEARSFFNGLMVDNNASVPKGVDRLKEELAMAEQGFADIKHEMPAKAELGTTEVIAATADTSVATPPENSVQLADSDDPMEPPPIEATNDIPTNKEMPSTRAGQETEERAKVEGSEEQASDAVKALEEDVAAKAAEIKAHLQAEEAAGTAKAYLESLESNTAAVRATADDKGNERNEAGEDEGAANMEPEKDSPGASFMVAEAKVEDAPAAAPDGDTGLIKSGKKKKKKKSSKPVQDPEDAGMKKKKKRTKTAKKKSFTESKTSQDGSSIDASHPPVDVLDDSQLEAEPSHPMSVDARGAEEGKSTSAASSEPGTRPSADDAHSDTPRGSTELSASDKGKKIEPGPAEISSLCDNADSQMNTTNVEARDLVLCELPTTAAIEAPNDEQAASGQAETEPTLETPVEAGTTSSMTAEITPVSDGDSGSDSTRVLAIEDNVEEENLTSAALPQEVESTEVEAKTKVIAATEEALKERNTVDENNIASFKDSPKGTTVSAAEKSEAEDAQNINSATLDTAVVAALQVSTKKTETVSSEPELTEEADIASKDWPQETEAVEDTDKCHSVETKEAAIADVQEVPSEMKSHEATTDEAVIDSAESNSTEEIRAVSKDVSVNPPATGSSNSNSEVDATESKSEADTPVDESACQSKGKEVDDCEIVINNISKDDEKAGADVLVIKDISLESDPVPMKLWSTADPVGDSSNEGPPKEQAPGSATQPTKEENIQPTVVFKGWGSAGPVADLARLKSQGSIEVSSDESDVKVEESSPPQEAEASSFFSLGAAPRFSWNPFQSSEGAPIDSGDRGVSIEKEGSPNSGAEESKTDDGEKDGESNNSEGSNDKKRSSPAKSLAGFLGLSNHGPSSVSPEKQKEEQWEEKMERAEHTKIDSSTHSFDSQDSLILKAMADSASPKISDQPPTAISEESLPTEVNFEILPKQGNEAVPAVSPRNDPDSEPAAENTDPEESAANDEKPVLNEKANSPIEETRLAEETTDIRAAAKELLMATEEAKLEDTASSRPSRSFEKQEPRRRRSRSFNRLLSRDQAKSSEQPPPPRRQRSKVDRDAKRAQIMAKMKHLKALADESKA